jgi:metal-sulfur cluster biosynthetic enzyme
MVTKEEVMKALGQVIDPEIGVPITEMQLVDSVEMTGSDVAITFHLSMPYCPPMFAFKIASDIRQVTSALPGVTGVKVKLVNHFMAEQINAQINK